MPSLGAPELIIIAIVILVLFGGAKLAGLGKSTGRALREFKEETKSLKTEDDKKDDKPKEPSNDEVPGVTQGNTSEFQQYPSETVDAEVVDSKRSES